MAYEKEITNVENILKGSFANDSDKRYWENKLIELRQKQYVAGENEKILKKAGYLGYKNWG